MDGWQIASWVLALIFNIGVVAGVRVAIQKKGNEYFFNRGRGAFVLLFVLSFAEKLVLGHFAALDSAEALLQLVQDTLVLVGSAMGLHITGGGLKDITKQLKL